MKIKITGDSTLDLMPEHLEKYDISLSPLFVNLGTDTFFDGIDIDGPKIFAYVAKNGQLPKTAARSPEDFEEFFGKFLAQGYDAIIHFSLSSKISLSNESAKKAAEKLKNVYVIDTMTLSSGSALLALYANDLKEQGLGAEEIYQKCLSRVPNVQASFVIDTLQYLHMGGRCSSLALLMSSLLKLKPTILLCDGKMQTGKKYLGKIESIILKYVENILEKNDKPDYTRIFVTHSYAEQQMVDTVVEYLQKNTKFKNIIPTYAGATITAHCGKNTLGILYINDGGVDCD